MWIVIHEEALQEGNVVSILYNALSFPWQERVCATGQPAGSSRESYHISGMIQIWPGITPIWPLLLPSWAFSNIGSQASLSETPLLSLCITDPYHYGHFRDRVISLFLLQSVSHILLRYPSQPTLSGSWILPLLRHLLNLLQCMSSGNPWRLWMKGGWSGYT